MESHELEDYQRLRREGRWLEANEFREVERKRLPEVGRHRQEALAKSWELMLERFPPLDVVAIGEGADSGDVATGIPREFLNGLDDTRSGNSRDVVEWVFENAYQEWEDIDAKSAPNGGAIGLLAWVKISGNNYGEFVRALWTKLLPTKGHSESGPRFADDGRKTFRLLEEFEASFNAAEGQRIVELVKG